MPNFITHKRTKRRKTNGKLIITKKIGDVQTNLNGNTTDVLIRTDTFTLMNGFPGPESFLPKAIIYVRKKGLTLTIKDKASVLTLAEKYNFPLFDTEVKQTLRRSSKICEINRLAAEKK